MFGKYWWIIPLITFVIPILWWIIRESQPFKIDKSTEYNLKNSEMLDVPFVYIVCWVFTGAFLIGYCI